MLEIIDGVSSGKPNVRRKAWQNTRNMPTVRIAVYVQPRAAKTALAGEHGGTIKIRIAAAPVDDAANEALIEFIAARLGIAKRRVRVVSGATGRRKVVEIDDVGADTVAMALHPDSKAANSA
jgi:uncharacterized protein (TIGR00251 family)